jgi:hypothetical protein
LDDKRRIVEVLQVLECIHNARGALCDARGYLALIVTLQSSFHTA